MPVYGTPTVAETGNPVADYRSQTLQAIAKVAAVRPEMGQQLMDAYSNRGQQAGGFWSGLWGGVSSVINFVQRPLSAIAETFRYDPEENDNPLQDIWQGLSGQKHTSFSEVLSSRGLDPDSWATRITGFALDVGVDPLTYIGVGNLGHGLEAAVKSASTITAEGAEAVLKQAAKTGAATLTTKGGKVVEVGADFQRSLFDTVIAKSAGKVDDDIAAGLAGVAAKQGWDSVMREVHQVAQTEAKWLGQRMAQAVGETRTVRSIGKDLVSPHTGFNWTPELRESFLREGASMTPARMAKLAEGHWLKKYSEDLFLGRRTAAAIGGVRVKFGMPFAKALANKADYPWLAYRYTSAALELPYRVTPRIGNFFRGTSKLIRFDAAMHNPALADVLVDADRAILVEKGTAALRNHFVQTGRGEAFAKIYGNKGVSSYVSAAERMGKLTESVTPKARMWRTHGLYGVEGANKLRMAQASKKNLRQYAARNEEAWAKATYEWATDPAVTDEMRQHSLAYFEGLTDDLSPLPEYIHPVIKEMREFFPDVLEKGKGMGADLGDVTEVFAHRRATRLRGEAQSRIAKLQRLDASLEAKIEGKAANKTARGRDTAALDAQLADVRDELATLGVMRQEAEAALDPQYWRNVVQRDGKDAMVAKMQEMDDVVTRLKGERAGKRVVNAARDRLTTLRKEAKALKPLAEAGDQDAITQLTENVAKQDEFTSLIQQVQEQSLDAHWTDITSEQALQRMAAYDKRLEEWGVKRIADKASPSRYFGRVISRDAFEALRGSALGDNKLFRGILTTIEHNRQLVDMTLEQADAWMREAYPALKSVPKVFEDNFGLVYANWVEKVAEGVHKANMGSSAKYLAKDLGGVDNGVALHLTGEDAARFEQRVEVIQEKLRTGVKDKDTMAHTWVDRTVRGMAGDISKLPPKAQETLQILSKELNSVTAESLAPHLRTLKSAMVDARKVGQNNMTGFASVDAFSGSTELRNLLFQPFIAAEFNKEWAKGLGKATSPLRQYWRELVLGPWKSWATLYWPGFHVKNMMGGAFNNWLGGVKVAHYGDALNTMKSRAEGAEDKLWRRMSIEGGPVRDVTHREVAQMAEDVGITGGNSLALYTLRKFEDPLSFDPGHAITRKLSEKTGVTGPEKFMRGWEKRGIGVTQTTENLHRLAAFHAALEQTGGDIAASRAFVMMRHGDYEELTDFEQNLKDLIPFYKWLRTNLPFQVRTLMESPGKTLGTLKAQNALVPEDQRSLLPEWMRGMSLIPTPGDKNAAGFLVLDLPINHLYLGADEFFSSFLPVVKPIFENYVIHKDIFTGQPLEGVKREEMADWMHYTPIPYVMDFMGLSEKNQAGNFTITDQQVHLLNGLPIFAKFRNFLSGDEDRKSLRWNAFASGLTGMGYRPIGAEELNNEEAAFFFEEIQPVVESLRELGYVLPSINDITAAPDPSTSPNPALQLTATP